VSERRTVEEEEIEAACRDEPRRLPFGWEILWAACVLAMLGLVLWACVWAG